MNQVAINASADGDNVLVNVATGDRVAVYDYCLIALAGTGLAILKDEAGTEFGRYQFAAAGNIVVIPAPGDGGQRFVGRGDIIVNNAAGLDLVGHITAAIR